MKYHKSLGMPDTIKYKAQCLVEQLRDYNLTYTLHAGQSIQDEGMMQCIKEQIAQYTPIWKDVFEVVEDCGIIEKVAFRFSIDFSDRDIVIVVSKNGKIITLWTNANNDKHSTLNKLLYATK